MGSSGRHRMQARPFVSRGGWYTGRITVAAVFAAATVFFVAALHADSDKSEPTEIEITVLQAAKLLIKAGRWEEAHALLLQAQPQTEEQWVERLFLLGLAEVQLNNPAQAVERFESILERYPDLVRVRLELAAAYYSAGFRNQAKTQFESALGYEMPSSVEDVVESFISRIDAQNPWSSSFSIALLPEAKPKRISGQDQILLGGVPFALGEDDRPNSGVGLQLSGGVAYSPPIAENLRGLLIVSGTVKTYARSVWNDISLAVDGGVTQTVRRGSVSQGLRLAWQRVANERYRRSIGIWVRPRVQLSNRFSLELPVSIDFHKYDTESHRDGSQISVKPKLNYLVGKRSLIAFEPQLEQIDAEKAHHRYSIVGLGLRFKRTFESGLLLTLNPYYQTRKHQALDPLTGFNRTDKQRLYRISLSHPSWKFRSFSAELTYTHETNWSNYPAPRKYLNQGLSLGVSRSF